MFLAETSGDRTPGLDRRAVVWFERLFGAALVAEVATNASHGVWHVHTGRFYPWRHLGILPLYPAPVLALEWALLGGAGVALVLGFQRAAAFRTAAIVLFVSVLERYSNHGALLFLVALYVSLRPPSLAAPRLDRGAHPNLGLVRAQLVIVYGFSALNKLTHGFWRGDSLTNLLGLAHGPAMTLACLTIAAELLLPALLLVRPKLGVVLVAVLHLAFALAVPGVVSFGIVMLAMALLFL